MRKKTGLADIQREDELNEKSEIGNNISEIGNKRSEKVNLKSEKVNPKSDFIKISVTLSPDQFYALEEKRLKRRREKQPHTMSELVRESVHLYLNS